VHQLTHHVRVLRTQLDMQQEQAQLGLGTADTETFAASLEHHEYAFPGGLSTIHAHTGGPESYPDPAVEDTHHGHHRTAFSTGRTPVPHAHTVHSARQVMSAQSQHRDAHTAHLSRTVPLTPASAQKAPPGPGDRLHFTSPHPAYQHHGSSGTDAPVRDARAVPAPHSYYRDSVEVIRASIPPAPWEQE
jgi:hypothetical protein